MLKFETNDINDLLRKWDETKKEISELESIVAIQLMTNYQYYKYRYIYP